jgi:integrase
MISLSPRTFTYGDFIQNNGRIFQVARRDNPNDRASFSFEDDFWMPLDLLKPHQRNFDGKLSFVEVPEWLKTDAKHYIAHLWLRTGAEANLLQQVLVSLRDLGRLLPDFHDKPVDLRARHAREFVRRYCELNLSPISNQRARRLLNNFAAFVRRQNPEVKDNDFHLVFPRSKTHTKQHQPLEQAREAKISTDVLAAIIDAIALDVAAYYEAKRTYIDPIDNQREYQARFARERYRKAKLGLPTQIGRTTIVTDLLGRAIKGQAVILAICVGRRAAAICNTRFDVRTEKMEWVNDIGQKEKGVLVRFREMKLRQIDEDVACPDAFGELAMQAIKTARELTADLRRDNPQWADYLFLVPGRKRKSAFLLTPGTINGHLNGNGGTPGVLQRYQIPVNKITTHNFRHTRATNAWLGGMQVHEVAYDLGHMGTEMTLRHYIVGSEESKRRLQELMDRGALSGALEEIAGGREMVQTRLGKRHVEIMRRQGRILTPTRYGYCALPAASGPCPRATPCYIGPVEGAGGCDHHILSPDALPALEEDRELLETNLAFYRPNPDYRVWVRHQEAQLAVVERAVERAKALQRRLDQGAGANSDKR